MTRESGRPSLPRIPDGHLDWLEVMAILILFTTRKGFLTFEERVARAAQTAAWSVPFFSALLSMAWLWPLVAVLRAHPRMNLIDITEQLAGRAVAILLGLAFSAYMIGVAVTDTDEVSHALNTSVMPRTPHAVVLARYHCGSALSQSQGHRGDWPVQPFHHRTSNGSTAGSGCFDYSHLGDQEGLPALGPWRVGVVRDLLHQAGNVR